MSGPGKVPEELRYLATHEWFRVEGDELVVGLTDHAQSELTDVVFVDLPAPGKAVAPTAAALSVESVKTVSDVFPPVAGTVTQVNAELRAHPEYVNQDPYGKGWVFRMRPAAPVPSGVGLSAAEYRQRAASASSA